MPRAWAGFTNTTWRWTRKQSPKGGYDLSQLRSLQDWFVRYQLNAVPGVAEVGSIGGFVRQYQIEVSPGAHARRCGSRSQEVLEAVEQSNLNVGGKVIEENGMEFVVRGLGLVNPRADLENIVLKERGGTPIYLRDVATIQLGGDFRRGALDVDGREVVGGMVVMRNGENGLAVIRAVKEKIAQITPSLPPGVTHQAVLRPQHADRAADRHAEAGADRGDPPGGAGAHPFPLALPQHPHRDAAAAGLDPDLVHPDAPVRHHLEHHVAERHRHRHRRAGGCRHRHDRKRDPPLRAAGSRKPAAGGSRSAETWQATLQAAQQVGRPIFFAMMIIILAFIPVFTLAGQEGKLFHPLAFTKTFAMIGATLLAVTIVPVLCTLPGARPVPAGGRRTGS